MPSAEAPCPFGLFITRPRRDPSCPPWKRHDTSLGGLALPPPEYSDSFTATTNPSLAHRCLRELISVVFANLPVHVCNNHQAVLIDPDAAGVVGRSPLWYLDDVTSPKAGSWLTTLSMSLNSARLGSRGLRCPGSLSFKTLISDKTSAFQVIPNGEHCTGFDSDSAPPLVEPCRRLWK